MTPYQYPKPDEVTIVRFVPYAEQADQAVALAGFPREGSVIQGRYILHVWAEHYSDKPWEWKVSCRSHLTKEWE